MPYEPLHHKYRPQTFANLVGQEAIASTLTNALQQERIAPAYLFTGPRGTGKTSSARILAKSLNCLAGNVPTATPCGQCQVCREVAVGSALDVIEIDAASNTGVDNIRELIERAQFAPVQCRYKVYIIDEVHMLSVAAFNALLKTLEEPPKHVVFILATTDPQRVLPTIISRCQRFDFRRIPLEPMVKHLREIASQENINITGEALTLVGQVAQGGLRDAESLLDQLSLLSGQVTVERVWDLVGAVPERDLMALLKAIANDNAQDVLDIARRLMDRGREPLIVLQNLAGFYRDLLIAKTAPSRPDLVTCTAQTWAELCEFANRWEISLILAGQKHLKDSEVQLKNTTQPRLWLEVTLLGLLPSAISTPQSIARVETRPYSPQSVERRDRTTQPDQPPPAINKSAYSPSEAVSQAPSIQPIQPEEVKPNSLPTPTPVQVELENSQSGTTESEPISSIIPDPPTPYIPAVIEPSPSISEPVELAQDQLSLDEVWQKVLAHVQPIANQQMLSQLCRLVAFNGQTASISIRVKPRSKKSWLEDLQKRLPSVEAAFQAAFNLQVKVSVTAETQTGTQTISVSNRQTVTNPVNVIAPTIVEPQKQASPVATTYAPSSVQVQTQAEMKASPSTPAPEVEKPLQSSVFQVSELSDTRVQPDTLIQTTDLEIDEVAIAAQQLAAFFKGEVVKLTDDLELSEPVVTNNLKAEFKPQPLEPTAEFEAAENWEDEDVEF